MQKRVDEPEAADSEPSWYLTRGGEQIGPLSGRELALFAEGGNFKPGDFVWTVGFDGWKPADDVFGLTQEDDIEEPSEEQPSEKEFAEPSGEAAEAPTFSLPISQESDADFFQADEAEFDTRGSFTLEGHQGDATFGFAPDLREAHGASEPNGEDVNALVQALTGTGEPQKPTLKTRLLAEARKFAGIFVYLWVVFTVLLVHEWIVLSQNHIGFAFYGLATINAFLLAKVILVAEQLGFAERLKSKPLIYSIVYKAVAFTTLLFIAYTLEVTIVGWLGGGGFAASLPNVGGGLAGAFALWIIFCVALLPFFGFKEFERAVGTEMTRKLLFGS